MSTTVIVQHDYSYSYKGKTVSFKKGERFQLLNKANSDWWQVRRWNQGVAEDVYVPAVYLKEVKAPLLEEIPPNLEMQSTHRKKLEHATPDSSVVNSLQPFVEVSL